MIKESENFTTMDWNFLQDPVITCLLCMEIYDWEKPDGELHQATKAICFSTVLGCHLLDCIMLEEDKVPV